MTDCHTGKADTQTDRHTDRQAGRNYRDRQQTDRQIEERHID